MAEMVIIAVISGFIGGMIAAVFLCRVQKAQKPATAAGQAGQEDQKNNKNREGKEKKDSILGDFFNETNANTFAQSKLIRAWWLGEHRKNNEEQVTADE